MLVKDFNTLILFGQKYDKTQLLAMAQNQASFEEWEVDFWTFIVQWFNDQSHIIVKSSGSTGRPKEISISKQKMLHSAASTCKYLKIKTKHKALLCMSSKHIGGMMMIVRAIYAQLDLHFVKPSANPLQELDTPIDFIALVPYQAHKVLEGSPKKLQAISNIIIGGGKVDYALEQKLITNKIKAWSTFGMTETISHIALKEIGKSDYYNCLPGIEISISQKGTLVIHAPNILDAELHTNDLIEFVAKDKFRWLGRLDFAIEIGGLKFIPEVLEEKIASKLSNPFLISSVPHPTLGQELILIIEGNKEMAIPVDIFSTLHKYEIPKRIFFLDKLSYTTSGKIDRNKTKERIE